MGNLVIKTAFGELQDIDEAKGYVEAYANVYNVKDSHGDISMPGSFKKTVEERKNQIKVYKNHNDNILVGVPVFMDANDPYGLKTGTQFNMKTDAGRDTFNDVVFLIQQGKDAGVSIGTWIVDRDKRNKSLVLEQKLKEYSFLTKDPSNGLSLATSFKSIEGTPEEYIELLNKMISLPYSDERKRIIENTLKSLETKPSSEDIANPIDETTLLNEEPTVSKSFFQIVTQK